MRVGLDIGSTTIKCAVIDDAQNIVWSAYERHNSHILEKTRSLLKRIREHISSDHTILAISGSAGMGLAERINVPFVQEVYAERIAAGKRNPETDCIIELGGEDAKILFLTNGTEVRMNGTCAGGTGAFIDQMAALLKLDSSEMNKEALKAERTYTIASRCGVFAKSDIQPLINQGARTSDIAASIYLAVANQTIAGLAQGRPVQGNILYLGGPLTFSSCLRRTFDQILHVKGTCPEHSLYYVAIGAALYAQQEVNFSIMEEKLEETENSVTYRSLEPLFNNRDEYLEFHNRHMKASVKRVPFDENCGRLHIGIDSGSTTIKMVIINDAGELLFTDYRPNDGNPVPIVRDLLKKIYDEHPGIRFRSAAATGYGEALMTNAFHLDTGLVETVAHYTAARHFMPDVDFIIDIGGQDMKCFKIEDGAVSDIFLNEACSSGCGSFLQTFAQALGYTVEDFSQMALFAKHPVDLGSRCTVFMNSAVKQAQKDGAPIDCISAGFAVSVIKNALYKVIRCSSAEQLGKKIVVQGGTFYNEAVLRAFEKEMGTEVIRPDIAGLMGAYGAALYAKNHCPENAVSSILTREELENFTQNVSCVQCQGCGNHCQLTINQFTDGKRFISGNRCEKPVTGKAADDSLNLYAYKLSLLEDLIRQNSTGDRGTIGIPLCLNMYELLPFWHTFFRVLGYRVITSPVSTKQMYQNGQGSIPSDTACYPAKLAHGHIRWLIEQNTETIWYPCMSYNVDESLGDNHYNCPVVAYYPEIILDNMHFKEGIRFLNPFIDLSNRTEFRKRFPAIMSKYFPELNKKEILSAVNQAYESYDAHMKKIREKSAQIIEEARRKNMPIIVLAGRPYHIDSEVNHGIDRLIVRQNAAVITEDSISHLAEKCKTSVLNQWSYHSRLYAAAEYCTTQKDMNLIQLVSFGCGLDAVTTDETKEILQEGGLLYTQLKIDEITNLGAVNIRIRSLFAALQERKEKEGGNKWNI